MTIHHRLLSAAAVLALAVPTVMVASSASATPAPTPSETRVLASGLEGTSGGAIGPDGALYVTEGAIGVVTRIDPLTGAQSTFASGLPPAIIDIGGAIDIAFHGRTAYVLVSNVGADFEGTNTDGIYRVDGPSSFTVIADIGTWSREHPPTTAFDLPSGVQFALQSVPGGFLVSDGHHNRVLGVSLSGRILQLKQFDNIVPTGLELSGTTVYMAEAGPIPHNPADGKVIALGLRNPRIHTVASGFSLLTDVEVGPCRGVYALSQGDSPGTVPAGSPALRDSGELLLAQKDGSFAVVAGGLDLPTSVDFVGNTAYVVAGAGEVLVISNVSPAWTSGGCRR
ncbi:glucose/arabinose dehydrogenase [Okibacterium sp. HSC-33S16]|uniref:ScyD/ScyE family protein n=1 Tax=Okibacterium sp. HSC-33S16 TaxID=2910965 RepID=UPI0020A19389|nr:ScyD/ScyE family protein [Okibacterium sp. HSC-33S16]MCP2031309.1 glucose/arabinose dehydrogenase [Okibacterium sp. HSC-33S16]